MTAPRVHTAPYRPLPVLQSPPVHVFCKDCVHFERTKVQSELCHAPDHDSDPIDGHGNPRTRNAKLDCEHHIRRTWLSRLLG